MKFEVYNYQCSPAEWTEGNLFSNEARKYREEALKAMINHLAIIDSLLTNEKTPYPMGANSSFLFKEDNTLYLMRPRTRKPKNASPALQNALNSPYLRARLLYAEESFYVLTVQNKSILNKEINWEKSSMLNMPSCIVIIANTEGRQLLLVEDNQAFYDTKTVVKIFQNTLRIMLRPRKLNITFRPHYNSTSFWQHMKKKYLKGIGLRSVKFYFDYPNMAQDAKLLGTFLKEFSEEMNAESQYTITGQHGQSLNINPQKPDPNLASIIEYAGKTGNKLQVVYCDKSRYTYDAEHVGISSLEATKQIEGWIKNWVREMLEGQRQTLTEQYDKSEFHSHLTNFLNGLEEGTDSRPFGK